jgi:hypothetical protein
MSRIVIPKKRAPAGCLIPFGLIFLLAGLAVCWFAKAELSETFEVRKWIPTPCQVTLWEARLDLKGDNFDAVARIAYNYSHAGKSYAGYIYDASNINEFPTLNEIEEMGVYARRGPSTCYVNPGQPDLSSFILPSYASGGAVLGLGLIFAGAGALIAMNGILSLFRRTIDQDAVVGRTAKGCAGGILAPIFFSLFAITGFTVWKLALHNQPDWKSISARMVPVPAKVLASSVATSSSGRNSSTTYKAKIAFEYNYDGRTWRSGWLDFSRGTTSSSNHGKAAEAAARYPVGSTPNAWVDPEAPWQAVLEKESGSRWWLWLFPLIFGGIGILGLLGWLLKVTALGAALFGTRRAGGS